MANTNQKTAKQAAAENAPAPAPATAPAGGEASQPEANQDSQPAGDGEPSEREKQLTTERDTVTAERDEAQGQVQQLKTELLAVTGERDQATGQRDAAVRERDELRYALNEEVRVHTSVREMRDSISEDFYKYRLAHGEKPAENLPAQAGESAAAAQEPSEEDTIKDLLKRNGLKKCWMLPSGPCFSEQHAREYAGEEFDSLTVISLDTDAGTN